MNMDHKALAEEASNQTANHIGCAIPLLLGAGYRTSQNTLRRRSMTMGVGCSSNGITTIIIFLESWLVTTDIITTNTMIGTGKMVTKNDRMQFWLEWLVGYPWSLRQWKVNCAFIHSLLTRTRNMVRNYPWWIIDHEADYLHDIISNA